MFGRFSPRQEQARNFSLPLKISCHTVLPLEVPQTNIICQYQECKQKQTKTGLSLPVMIQTEKTQPVDNKF